MADGRRVAVYPGTFDPITFGHTDLINRALKVFDHLIVAVSESEKKGPLFSLEERIEMVKDSVADNPRVSVEGFSGLTVEYAKQKGASALVRGLRMLSDFEYEFQMALTNRKLCGEVETMFLMPHQPYTVLTSGLIKEVAQNGGDIKGYVSEFVYAKLKNKFEALGDA